MLLMLFWFSLNCCHGADAGSVAAVDVVVVALVAVATVVCGALVQQQ